MKKSDKKKKKRKDIRKCFGLLAGEDLSEVEKIMEEVRRAPWRTNPAIKKRK
jgi:hypothetical protein